MAHRDGQAQLQGTLNLPLFACSDIGSDGFRGTFHRFGRHIQASQQFDLPPSMVEWRFRANQRQHASDTGRQIRFLYVQSCIGRTLPVMAVRTQIPGAQQLHLSQCGLHAPRTHLPVPGLVTAGTRHLALIRAGGSPCSNWLNANAPARCMAARVAISTASRSSLPVLRCSSIISRSRAFISRSNSCRIVSAVFFPVASACLRQALRGRSSHWCRSKSGSVPDTSGNRRPRVRLCAAPQDWESSR